MSSKSPSADAIVVGGGVVGLSCAFAATGRGMSVMVVDPAPGRAASWAAAGMLAPVTEAHYGEEALLALNLSAARTYPEFVATVESVSGVNAGYRRTGTLVVARDADDNAALDDLFRFQVALGLHVERLRGSECRALEAGLAPSIRGGILVAGDHQVDNRALVDALRRACVNRGVQFVPQFVAAVDVGGERVRGVRLEDGSGVAGGAVVLAAGAVAGSVAGVPDLPVRPVKGQLLHLRGPATEPLSDRSIRGLDVYVVPRGDGRIVVGATVEEKGHDLVPTAGGVFALLRAAYELLPGMTELELAEVAVGLRPGTPDNAPLIGPWVLENLYVATGHYRNGILLAGVTGDAIATALAGDPLPEEVVPFDPHRFDREEQRA